MISTLFFTLSLVVALGIGFIYFRDLGDISQMVLSVKRENMIRIIRNENQLLATGLGATALMAVLHLGFGAGAAWLFWIAILLIAFLYGFTYIWVHLGLRNQVDSAKFYSIDEARQYVSPSSPVIVIEKNGVARAHPDHELMRPHIAGNNEGLDGENVVMTYCSMANLGVAYSPEIDDQKVELEVLAQHGNNLILRDNTTGEPIQHIYGFRERDGATGPAMKPWPTFRMSFRGFQKAYPDGEVFLNKPAANLLLRLLDMVTETAFSIGIARQHREERPVMDNMTHEDHRLPNKTYIWGINIGDDAVCYTQDFLVENGNLINAEIGGRNIVVAWDPLYESVGAYYNSGDVPVSEINFFGKSDQGQLPRVETTEIRHVLACLGRVLPAHRHQPDRSGCRTMSTDLPGYYIGDWLGRHSIASGNTVPCAEAGGDMPSSADSVGAISTGCTRR